MFHCGDHKIIVGILKNFLFKLFVVAYLIEK